MESIKQILLYLNTLSASAPFVGGVVAVAVTGTLGFLFFKMPRGGIQFINTMFTVRFAVNNGGYGENQVVFANLIKWFSSYKGRKITRSYGYEGINYGDGAFGPENGNHYLLYKGLPLKITIRPLESSGSEKMKKEITIVTLFFFRKAFFKIVDEITSTVEEKDLASIRDFADGYWRKVKPIAERRLSTIVVADNKLNEIIELIDDFLVSKEWYRMRGIPYKLSILLYGPPGTGKTSIVKALAYHYNYHIASIPIHACGDMTFIKMVHAVPKNTFLLIEDIDTCNAVSSRKPQKDSKKVKEEQQKDSVDLVFDNGLNLSTVLNTFDGVAELDGQIIFKTTNHPEKLDEAIYRPGRVDKCILIDALDLTSVSEYIKMVFPDYPFELPVSDIRVPGSKLQELFQSNKRDPDNFVQEIAAILRGEKPAVVLLEAI